MSPEALIKFFDNRSGRETPSKFFDDRRGRETPSWLFELLTETPFDFLITEVAP
jgi:hypothetical protein